MSRPCPRNTTILTSTDVSCHDIIQIGDDVHDNVDCICVEEGLEQVKRVQ